MPDEGVPTPRLTPVIRIVTAREKAGTNRDQPDLIDLGVSKYFPSNFREKRTTAAADLTANPSNITHPNHCQDRGEAPNNQTDTGNVGVLGVRRALAAFTCDDLASPLVDL